MNFSVSGAGEEDIFSLLLVNDFHSILHPTTDHFICHFYGIFDWRQCGGSGAHEVSHCTLFAICNENDESLTPHTIACLFSLFHSVRHIHEVEPSHPAGFWKKKWTWKARWVKTWRPKKVYVATWKRVWGPVSISEWVPLPPKHILPVPHLSHIQELPHFKR